MNIFKRLNLLDYVIILGAGIIAVVLCFDTFAPKKKKEVSADNIPLKIYVGDYYIEAEIKNVKTDKSV